MQSTLLCVGSWDVAVPSPSATMQPEPSTSVGQTVFGANVSPDLRLEHACGAIIACASPNWRRLRIPRPLEWAGSELVITPRASANTGPAVARPAAPTSTALRHVVAVPILT